MYLDYAGVRVRDLAASVAFYTKALGLREQRRGTSDVGGTWVLLEDPKSHQRLELNWYRSGSPYATRWRRGEERDHLGFRTYDTAAVARRLVAAGAREVERFVDDDGDALIYIEDPNGIQIELIPTPRAQVPVVRH